MKKLLLSIFALCAVVMSASAAKIYINPGHGSWHANCRNMLLVNIPNYGDTLGFYESNTNLWKGLFLEKKLLGAGHQVKMSRRYTGGTNEQENSQYDKALHVIGAESQAYGSDYFISIHSNAHQDGAVTNYPLFIHKGYDNSETNSGSIWGERILWTHHYEIWVQGQEHNSYPNYNNNNKNIRGGLSMNGWDYGVLRTQSRPGTLVEGYFHTYQPGRHRAMQPDWCRQEGLRYFRGFTEMYGSAKDTKGYIMGYIRTKDKQINQTNYTGRSANDIYYPMNGARVVLRNAKGELIKTDPYKYVARDFVSQAIYTTDGYYNGVFVYDDLAPGKYKIYVHCKGYKDLVQEVTVTAHTTTYTQLFVTAGTGTEPNTAPTLDPDVKWVLNGGIVPGGKVPTNAELWSEFKGYYSTWYNETRADQEITAVSTFMTKGCDLMTNAKSEYKWLGDYIMEISAEQGITLTSNPSDDGMEALWRWSVHAFFNCNKHDSWPYTADFSTAGKPEKWGDTYRVAKGISAELPYTITGDYTIPTPIKDGYDFLGWYDQNSTSGTKYTKLTAGWKGTLYALWQETPKGDVTWVLNGGSVSVTLPNYITDAPYTLPTPTRTGYVFLGWYDNAKGDGEKLTQLPVGFKGSVYAIWREAVVTWELNGGELPKAAEVPTNDSLWNAFKPYYNEYYGLNRADQPITAVSTFAAAKMCEIMTKADSEWKWLGDYIYKVSTDQGVHLSIDPTGDGVEAMWRWTVHSFFNCNKHETYPVTADYTTAGKNTAWGPNYQAKYGKGVTLPTKITSAYTIPTPTKTGADFKGWYDTNNDSGNKLTVLPVGYDGTVYAIWSDTKPVDVKWELNGGKVSVTLPTTIEATYTLPTPTKEGYVFLGWYDNAEGTGNALTSLPVGYKGTVYAIWREAKVVWVLNGGKVMEEKTVQTGNTGTAATVEVPTNDSLWNAFKEYYKTFYNENRADQPITAVATFMTQGEKILTDASSEYKWLGDYIVKVATEQGYTIDSEALWRWHADAFFQANQHTSWPKTADFSTAGKPEAWGPAYQAAHGGSTGGNTGGTTTEWVEVQLPSKITGSAYTIPTPTKDNDEFIGWYDTNDNTGNQLTVLPVGYDGTVYAIWKSMLTPTGVEEVRPELDMDAPMYDVMGRRVDSTYRGIVIQSGRKYLLR
ncbi:MAG: InlB B-repeat-containing protein [Paludibacteraceae bacterium]|nr:InlB B-repeat-containing protein [Paludibacteraceae bacterium]